MSLQRWIKSLRHSFSHRSGTRRRNLQRTAGHQSQASPAAVIAESLEDRVLLSATELSPAEADALRDAVSAVDGFAGRLETAGKLASELPLIDGSIGELADVSGVFSEVIVSAVNLYLDGVTSTEEGIKFDIEQKISDMSHVTGTVTATSDNSVLSFNVDVDITRSQQVDLNPAEHIPAGDLKLDATLPAQLDFVIHMNLTFGIDRTAASAADGVFFEFADNPDTPTSEMPLQNAVTATGKLTEAGPISASLGFLQTTLDPSQHVDPPGGEEVAPFVNLTVAFDTEQNRVSAADLSVSDLSDVMEFDGSGIYGLTLPISTDVDGVTTTAADELKVDEPDLFDMAPAVMEVVAPALVQFRTISTDSLLSAIDQAAGVLSDMGVFDTEIPFTGGQTLDQVLNIRDAIQAQLIDPITEARNSPAATEDTATTLQDVIDLIEQRVSYDKDTNALEFDVSFDHTFDVATYDLDLGGQLGDLNDFSFSLESKLQLDATLQTAMKIGIVLAQPGAAFALNDTTALTDLPAVELLGDAAFVDGSEFRVTLRDGTTHEIDLTDDMTVGQLKDKLATGDDNPLKDKLEVSFVEEETLLGDNKFNTGLRLIDKTTGTTNDRLQIAGVNDSLLAFALGLAGSGMESIVQKEDGSLDEEKHGIVTGAIHGQSVANNLYLSPIDDKPMFTAIATLTAPIDASAQLGFIDIGIVDGEAVGQLTATFTPTDPTAEVTPETVDRITGPEILDFGSNATLRLKASKPVTFGDEYSGDVVITITEANSTTKEVRLPFTVPQINAEAQTSTNRLSELDLLASSMNSKLQELAEGGTAGADLIKVGSTGDRLTFTLKDGKGRNVSIAAGEADSSLAKLGITQELSGYVVRPKLVGSANFALPYTLSVADLNITGALEPDQTVINIDIPDLSIPDFNLSDAVNTDIASVGDHLSRLKDLEFASIVESLQGAAKFLRRLETNSAAQFLHEPLPLLQTDLSTILNVADVFGDIVVNLERNPAKGLGQVDEVIEDALNLPEGDEASGLPTFAVWLVPELNTDKHGNAKTFDFDDDGTTRTVNLADIAAYDPTWFGGTYDDLNGFLQSDRVQNNNSAVDLSLDTSGDDPALRIDLFVQVGEEFGLNVTPLSVTDHVSIDLSDVGFSGLSDFVDTRAEADIDIQALAQLHVAVGIELPSGEDETPRPFVYDGVGRGNTPGGTSVDFFVSAVGADIDFEVSIGPLGAELSGGTLSLTGSEDTDNTDDDDDSDNVSAKFTAGLADDNGDGRHYIDEIETLVSDTLQDGLDITDFDFQATGSAGFSGAFDFPGLNLDPLTTIFPALALPMDFVFSVDEFVVGTDGISVGDFSATIGDVDAREMLEEVRNILAGEFNVLSLVGGWDGAFDLLIEAMEGEVFGVELPFIGDRLKDQANFLREIKDSVSANLRDNAENVNDGIHALPFEDVRQDIFDALGPGGINLLKDLNADGLLDLQDVGIEQLDPGIGFEILVGSELAQLELPIDFDLGIPGLGLDIDANVTGALGFELGLKMGVDLARGFFIDTNDTFLEVFVDVAVPGLAASGELGFLRVDAAEILTPAEALVGKDVINNEDETEFDPLVKISSVATGSPANFDVRFFSTDLNGDAVVAGEEFAVFREEDRTLHLHIAAGETTATQLVETINAADDLSQLLMAALIEGADGSAVVDHDQRAVGVSNSFAGRFNVDIIDPDQEAPDGLLTLDEILRVRNFKDVISIDATAFADLNISLAARMGDAAGFPSIYTDIAIDWDYQLGADLQLPVIQLNNIELDAGEFFSGFVDDIFEEVESVIKPVRPIIDFLNSPMPVISDLGLGDITVLKFLQLQGAATREVVAFVEALTFIDTLTSSLPSLSERLPLGSAFFDINTNDFRIEGGVTEAFAKMAENLRQLAPASGDFDPNNFLKTEEELKEMEDDELKVGFPILNPTNVLGLLSGEVVDLFTLELPKFELQAGIKKFFPLPPLPVVGIELAGTFKLEADFAFGFDTFGIEQFKQTGNFAHIINGFFVFDHETADGEGEDIDELVLTTAITAAAEFNAAVLSASVGGGIFANVDFNLHDNNEDGKIRLVELLDNTLLGGKDGFGPIHIFDVDGAFKAKLFATVTADLGLFSIDKEFNLAEATLFEFEFPRPEGEGVQLAQFSNGRLNDAGPGGSVLELNIGPQAGRRNNIFTTDGAEDYQVFATDDPGTVIVEAFGRSQIYTGVNRIVGNAGAGNDKIEISEDLTIPVEISGGDGDDTLIGGSGDDVLNGNEGNDDVRGRDGNDVITGGAGRDTLLGGDGNDTVEGGDGDDDLQGEDGNDVLRADAGDDRATGGSGNDVILGGLGFDRIFGDDGNDELHGEDQADQIYGGDGIDLITGGGGDDRLFGEAGGDSIYAGTITVDTNGEVTAHDGSGRDELCGGVGNDLLVGDNGNDRLFGENSRDTIFGGGGDDLLEGGLASDELYGGLGDDMLFYNTSDVTQEEEASHKLVGGGGDDEIHASPLNFIDEIWGDGVNDIFGSIDSTTDGSDIINAGDGNDTIFAGGLHDVVRAAGGDDFVDAGPGEDVVFAGAGNDFVIGGFGDDELFAEDGDDVVWGGLAEVSDPSLFDRSEPANFTLPPRFAATEAMHPTGYVPPVLVTPAAVSGATIDGTEGDGRDRISGGPGSDLLFGGADADAIFGGAGPDYIDAGAGHDVSINGDAGDDVVRGGGNNDILYGGDGIDSILGDGGDDRLFGDAGQADGSTIGQRLFGGDGVDRLFAFAPTTNVVAEFGDQLFGDAGPDTLNGNMRQELLIGGGGNDLLRGDYLSGPDYAVNSMADQLGADDELRGGGGQDQLLGGGGNDVMWGGPDGDYFDGQKGDDTQYGGGGNDLFVVSAVNSLQDGMDIIDGHFGNVTEGDSTDDSTDILIINGTQFDDVIGLSQTNDDVPRLRIDYQSGSAASRIIEIDWQGAEGNPLIEQFQIAGLGGDDVAGLAGVHPTLLPLVDGDNSVPLDLSNLIARSNDWVTVIDGNNGDDKLIGSIGRDRIDGGAGRDNVWGFAGDDRLLGGRGFTVDHDVLFAGQGNDELIGGDGSNELFAWSLDPTISEFGIFVDDSGTLFNNSSKGTRRSENTGLNRLLGNIRDDELYGGTALDFMYGRGGSDTLYRNDGSTFESLGDGLSGTEWVDYARDTGQVWYVSGTNADDEIDVNYVTVPGLLADHHLVTILTDNNDNFSFDAQVRLDFAATDSDGNAIWNPRDIVADFAAFRAADTDEERAELLVNGVTAETNLVNNLLPGEGEFLAIIVDAKDGNDEVTIGPTVQKSVWVAGGAGDDEITIRGGNSILVDQAEIGTVNGLKARNDDANLAFALDVPAKGVRFENLTIDNRSDVDWFRFTLPQTTGTLTLTTESSADNLDVQIFSEARASDPDAAAVWPEPDPNIAPMNSVTIDLADIVDVATDTTYLLRVGTSDTPTIYGIEFDFAAGDNPASVDLSLRSDFVRRDILLGGPGDDKLLGGPGEDWILGGDGDDIISGGRDRLAADILLGEDGNDTFQIIPNELPLVGDGPGSIFDPVIQKFRPTTSDEIDGGAGEDRMLFVGGDLDRRGLPVPDFAALRYDQNLHRYEFSSLVWDIGQQKFLEDADNPDQYLREFLFYQTNSVEQTQIELGEGDDTFHADPGYQFPGSVGPEEWGIALGNFENRATAATLLINGGAGNDELFGGAVADTISGGPGDDIIFGSQGNDELLGGGGDDTIFGLKDTTATPLTPRMPDAITGTDQDFAEAFEFALAAPFLGRPESGRPGLDLNDLPKTVDLANQAFGLEGASEDEQLSSLRPIGDFNNDGLDDVIASSLTTSFILLGPVELDDIERIDHFVEIVIDHATFGRPAATFGDINGDGIGDLAFFRVDGNDQLVTTVFGGSTMTVNGSPESWPREWNADFVTDKVNIPGDSSFRTIRLHNSPVPNSESVLVHVQDITETKLADVIVLSTSTAGATREFVIDSAASDRLMPGPYRFGYIFSGDVVKAFDRISGAIDVTQADHAASLHLDGELESLLSAGGGDLDGDGVDELLFGHTDLSISVQAADRAFVLAEKAPRQSNDERYAAISPLIINVNGVGATLQIRRRRDSTTSEIADLINAEIKQSTLAGLVEASTEDGRIRIESTERGPVRLIVVDGKRGNITTQFGFPIEGILKDWPNTTETQIADDGETVSLAQTIIDTHDIINNARLFLTIDHDRLADLSVSLIHEFNGDVERVLLFDEIGGASNRNFGGFQIETRIHDDAPDHATRAAENLQPDQQYHPFEAMSRFDGRTTQGTWTLELFDKYTGIAGTLVDWKLQFQVENIIGTGSTDSSKLTNGVLGRLSQPTGNRITLSPAAGGESVTPSVIGDINNDGFDDVAMSSDDWLRIYEGTASFTRVSSLTFTQHAGPGQVVAFGDFDNDGLSDTVFSRPAGNQRKITIDYGGTGPNTEFFYAGGTQDIVRSYDLNGDSVDDLMVSVPTAESFNGATAAGQLFVIYGSSMITELPTSEVTDLHNFSVPGSGSFLTDLSTGRPETFSAGGDPFRLAAGTEAWFRFSTLGRGETGDFLRLIDINLPTLPNAPVLMADLIDSHGRELMTRRAAFDLRAVPAGDYYLKVYATDDSAPLFTIEVDPPSRQYSGSSTLPDRDLIDGGDGDDTLHGNNDIDRIAGSSGRDTVFAEPIEWRDSDSGDLQQESTAVDELISQDQPSAADPIIEFPLPGSEVFSDDFPNGLDGRGFDSAKWDDDLTTADVRNNDHATSDQHVARIDYNRELVSVEIDMSGFAEAELSFYFGADGQNAQLIVEYESDGEWTKLAILTPPNRQPFEFFSGRFSLKASTLRLRLSGSGTGSFRNLVDDLRLTGLRDELGPIAAEHLDHPVTANQAAAAVLHRPFYASDLVGITHLNASGTSFTDLTSLQHLPYLESLNFNGSTLPENLAPVAQLTKLRQLSLARTSVDVNSSDIFDIGQRPELESLILPVPNLTQGQNLVRFAGETVDITTTAAGSWTVTDEAGTEIASDSGTTISFTAISNGRHTVTHDHTGSFPIFIRNVAPEIQGLPEVFNLNEGSTQTVAQSLTGVTFVDSGVAPNPQVTVTAPDGTVQDLTTGSLSLHGDGVQLNAEVLNGATDFTLAFSMRTSDASSLQTLFSAADGSAAFAFSVMLNSATTLLVGNSGTPLPLDRDVANGEWHDFVIQRNSTTGQTSVWLGGVLQGQRFSNSDPMALTPTGLLLGGDRGPAGEGALIGFRAFTGGLDQVSIFRRLLTDQQIAGLHSDGVIGNEPDLALHLPLNETGGDIAHDRSPNARHGVVGPDNDATSADWSTDSTISAADFHPVNDGDYRLAVTVTDEDGAADRAESIIRVANVAPTAVIAPGAANELQAGNTLTFNALASSDVGVNDSLTYDWEITTNNTTLTAPSGTDVLNFTPQFAGTYTVKLTVTDDFGTATDSMVDVRVNPRPPGADISIATFRSVAQIQGIEGTALTFDSVGASDSAPVASRMWQWRTYFADEDNSETQLPDESGAADTFTFEPQDNGTYRVELTITDTIGAETYETVTSFNATVDNEVPTIDFGAATFTTEGHSVTLAPAINDPGTLDTLRYAWTITDSLGNNLTPTEATEPTITFVPADNGIYTAALTVTDKDGLSETSSTSVIAVNSVPSVSEGPTDLTFNEGFNFGGGLSDNEVVFQAKFEDLNASDGPFDFEWDFGDGSDRVTGVGVSGETLPNVLHAFADSGTYTVTLTVTDKDGGVGQHSHVVTINNVAPTVTEFNGPFFANDETQAKENQVVTFTGKIEDLNGTLSSESDVERLRGQIDFGDGIRLPILLTRTDNNTSGTAQYEFTSRHIYAEAGSYDVTIEVRDDDGGGTLSDVLNVIVAGPPTLTLQLPAGPISEDGTSMAVITRDGELSDALTVRLSSSLTLVASVPETVEIPAGESSADFEIIISDNSTADGPQTVTISARADLANSDQGTLTVSDDDVASLTVNLDSESINEVGTTTATISRDGDLSSPLTVTLASDDETAAIVPATITISAGRTHSEPFAVTAVDDASVDGSQFAHITATADGLNDGGVQLRVLDDERASLTLAIQDTTIAETGTTTASVIRNGDLDQEISVRISSSDETAAIVSKSVVIPAGQSMSAPFEILAVDDSAADGSQFSDIQVTTFGLFSDSVRLTVADNEIASFTLTIADDSISETESTTATITRDGDFSEAVTVNLVSSDSSIATVPTSVVIAAGQETSAPFEITAVDNATADGPQTITITGSASEVNSGIASLTVTDDESASLMLTLADSSINESGSTTATVSRDGDLSGALIVSITSSDETAAATPVSITIPAGQQSETFEITAIDDSIVDGPQTVSIEVSATGLNGSSTTLKVVDNEIASLTLVLAHGSISETGQTVANVVRNGDLSEPLTVNLVSSDTSAATVPTAIVIGAGQTTSVAFVITAVDNSDADGPKTLTITATGPNINGAAASLTVTDDESASLTLTLADDTIEETGSTTATVSRDGDLSAEVTVVLSSNTESAATVPASVTIPAGQGTSAPFTITAVDDAVVDGTQVATLQADAAGLNSALATISVTDDESPSLQLSLVANSIGEAETTTATITRNGDITSDLTVRLSSSDESAAIVPATIVIPAGQRTSQPIVISAVDDSVVDGSQTSTITATADGLTATSATLTVTDNDEESQRGNVDGDDDFDANDAFLIQLVKLAGTDALIDQAKGDSQLTATQIRNRIEALLPAGDVDGDNDFDANDAFLIQLVKLAGSDAQINQSKGASLLPATQIRANIEALGDGASPEHHSATLNWRQVTPKNVPSSRLAVSLSPEDNAAQLKDSESPSDIPALDRVLSNYRSWIDLF